MAFLSQDDIEKIGFKSHGENVLISDKASIYGAENISLASNIRIDDFAIISAGEGGITIGNYVHIACYCSLIGAGNISLNDFAGISSRVSVYSSSDDFSGDYLTGPTVPSELRNIVTDDVSIGKHVIVGSGAVILPGVTIGEGSAIGALSLVTKDCDPYGIYSGAPVKFIKARSKKIFQLEHSF